MKKRILSLLLAVCLIMALLPAAALAAAEPTTKEVSTAADLNEEIEHGTADIIKLMDNITLNNVLQIVSRTVTLDLNGYMLKGTRGFDFFKIGTLSSYDTPTPGHLTLTDSRANDPTAAHKFNTSTKPWSLADADATGPNIETVYGGVITSPDSMAIVVERGTFTMQSGSIVGCQSDSGGGVEINYDASFTMNGGQILGCYAERWDYGAGGGVRVAGTFTMTGGVIRGCKADDYGGGVYVLGTFTMTGGVIRDCKADNGDGDGVSMDAELAVFNADGGVVRDNVKLDWGTLTQTTNAKSATVFYGELTKDKGTINGNLVKFMVGEKQYAWEVVVDGKTAVAPEGPQATEGWTFGGWYTDAACTTAYDFSQPVTSNLDLYAKRDVQVDDLVQVDELAWLTPVLGAVNALTFGDVKSGDWFYDAVRYVNEYGLMTGTSSNHFSPNAPVTRGMVMTILARREGIKTDRYSPWYAAGVEWAKSVGISDGTNPEAPITREQLAAMLYRYAGLKGYDLSGAALTSYGDANSISGYATPAVQWAVGAGLMSGTQSNGMGKLLPQETATRAQLAAMLYRFFG